MRAVVLTLDRLPVAGLGCYGNLRAGTPQFDRLAAEAVVFDQHLGEDFSPDAAGHAWTTGHYQFPSVPAVRKSAVSLGDVLRENGTAAVVLAERGAAPIFRHAGLDTVPEIGGDTGLDADPERTPFSRLITEGIRSARRLAKSGGSWLLWLHGRGAGIDPLPPRAFVEQYADWVTDDEPDAGDGPEIVFDAADWQTARCLSAAAVGLIDWGLERLLKAVDAAAGREPPLLIVTAARGTPLADRAFVRENVAELASELVQTPLLIRTGDGHGDRRQELVQTVDLLPTLLDAFDIPADRLPCEGRSLLPLVRGEAWPPRPSLFLGCGPDFGGVRTADFYLTGPADALRAADVPRLRLFVKPDDLWDVHNVAPQSPAFAESLAAEWAAFVTR